MASRMPRSPPPLVHHLLLSSSLVDMVGRYSVRSRRGSAAVGYASPVAGGASRGPAVPDERAWSQPARDRHISGRETPGAALVPPGPRALEPAGYVVVTLGAGVPGSAGMAGLFGSDGSWGAALGTGSPGTAGTAGVLGSAGSVGAGLSVVTFGAGLLGTAGIAGVLGSAGRLGLGFSETVLGIGAVGADGALGSAGRLGAGVPDGAIQPSHGAGGGTRGELGAPGSAAAAVVPATMSASVSRTANASLGRTALFSCMGASLRVRSCDTAVVTRWVIDDANPSPRPAERPCGDVRRAPRGARIRRWRTPAGWPRP